MQNKWSSEGRTPTVLEKADLAAVAKYMKSNQCRNVVIMVSPSGSAQVGNRLLNVETSSALVRSFV